MSLCSASTVRRTTQIMLLCAVLIVHFITRWHAHQNFPLSARHNYSTNYEFSLSLVAGEGLRTLGNLDSQTAAAVRDFLAGGRDDLSPEELESYVHSLPPGENRPGIEDHLGSTRILDLYVTAGLWKVFGVSWDVLYGFYCLVSTVSCGLVFAIARRLGGSFWPGVLAATLYTAMPLQSLLTILSIRDTSPLWFAVAGFWLLICATDRFRRRWANGFSFLALGVVAVMGLGWRWDAVLLVPVLGGGLVVILFAKGRRWGYVLAALALFLAGSGGMLTGIDALCHFQRMKVSTGFHIAYYGEQARCNWCGLENSLQADFCDLQTYFDACRLSRVVDGASKPLPDWCSPEYLQKCKAMYLTGLRYNLFHYVRDLPAFFWHVQGGLTSRPLIQGVEPGTTGLLFPPWTAGPHRVLCQPLLNLLPWLVTLGIGAALLGGSQAASALCLLGFDMFYTLMLFSVLPMQKHLALTLLPASVFAGMGLWTVVRLFQAKSWRGTFPWFEARPLRRCLVGAGCLAGLWLIALVGAYYVSVRERGEYLRAIEEVASVGSPAQDTLRGKQLFSVRIPPAAETPMTGYLLELRTGSQPGLLECRHVHHPTPDQWGKISWTHHQLQENRTQYFFTTCRDGASVGDFRPYVCTVSISGTAEIVSSTRVDLSHWDRLPFCTVFCPGERRAGSPEVKAPSSGGEFAYLAVSGSKPLGAKGTAFRGAVGHLIARNRETGAWRFAVNKSGSFELMTLTFWDPGIPWKETTLLGDFDGDGLTDVAGLDPRYGTWVVGRSDGAKLVNELWGAAKAGVSWTDLAVGDFDGDGRDDIFLRDPQSGDLVVALSAGKEFTHATWGQWSPDITWQHVRAGDFDGDGRTDIAGLDVATGQWWVARSTGKAFQSRCWGHWPAGVSWRHVCVGDFNGDGRSDLAGWDPRTGQWWVALSGGDGFQCRPVTRLDPADPWTQVAVADVDGDGRDALVGWSPKTGTCWVARLDGEQFICQPWGHLSGPVMDLCVADFDGDGRVDVAWRNPATGELFVGLGRGATLQVQPWGKLPKSEKLTPLSVYKAWR